MVLLKMPLLYVFLLHELIISFDPFKPRVIRATLTQWSRRVPISMAELNEVVPIMKSRWTESPEGVPIGVVGVPIVVTETRILGDTPRPSISP